MFSIFLDCLTFRGILGPSSHSGEHSDAIAIFVDHCNFPKWLDQFKGEYIQCLRGVEAKDTLEIVCVSHDGKLASVSGARILSHVLCHKAKEPMHFESKKWAKNGVCDGFCDDCNSDPCSPAKTKALA